MKLNKNFMGEGRGGGANFKKTFREGVWIFSGPTQSEKLPLICSLVY